MPIKNLPAPLKHMLKLAWHYGFNNTCPFCHYKSRDLSPIGNDSRVLKKNLVGGSGRRNGGCHNCGSTDRERLIQVYLKYIYKLAERDRKIRVLHIAPEKNLSKALLDLSLENYICGDLFAGDYKYPDHVVNMDVTNLPQEDGYFDLVICNHVLEHIPNDKKAISELYRVLKKPGIAILQVPISRKLEATFEDPSITQPSDRENAFGQFDHVRIYGQDYPTKLEEVGFKTNRTNLYRQFGLIEEEDLFINVK